MSTTAALDELILEVHSIHEGPAMEFPRERPIIRIFAVLHLSKQDSHRLSEREQAP